MLNGFEVYNYSSGTASLTLSDNGVGFSKTAVQKMGRCEYVKLLINFNEKMVAIQKCDKDDSDSILFFNPKKKIVSVRWSNKDLQKTILSMMGWNLREGMAYKADGVYVPEDNAMIFDLTKSELITTKKTY